MNIIGKLCTVAIFATFAIAASASGQGISYDPTPVDDPFPLEIGTQWEYAGVVWWTPRRGREVFRENINWTMEVVEHIERDGVRGSVVTGYPYDLVWYEEGRAPGRSVVIEKDDGIYHLLRGDDAEAFINPPEVALSEDAPAEGDDAEGEAPPDAEAEPEFDPADVVIAWPLSVGQQHCAGDDADPEGLDCWTVIDSRPTNLPGVGGVQAEDETRRYVVSYRTQDQHMVSSFVPGVGFTSFSLGQTARASAIELKLIHITYGPAYGLEPAEQGDETADPDGDAVGPEAPAEDAATP